MTHFAKRPFRQKLRHAQSGTSLTHCQRRCPCRRPEKFARQRIHLCTYTPADIGSQHPLELLRSLIHDQLKKCIMQ